MALPQAHAPDTVSFGKYELLGLLGAGGMAEVFLARAVGPMGFERRVVVKRILPHLSRDEEFVEMFVGEAKVSAVLSHGNIVQVYDFGDVDGQLFLAMEYVDGTDLRTLSRKTALVGNPLPPELPCFIALEVLSALAHAHDRADWDGQHLGLVHRDVSPSNVLLSRAGEVKLCDFGIAKIAARHTSTGRLKGKFAYMSPEQASGSPIDGRSDLWSIGVVLWELLAGRRLFQADSDVGIIAQVTRGDIPPLPKVAFANEELLRSVLGRALERDVDKRYPDATAMAEDLRDVLAMGEIRDPSRVLRELVQKFAVEPVLGMVPATVKTAPPPPRIAKTAPSTPRAQPIADAPTTQRPVAQAVAAAPATHSAIVEVKRSPVAMIVVLAVVFGVIAAAILLLWPSPRPTPHSTPWPSPTAPLLPRLEPRPASPPPAIAPAPEPPMPAPPDVEPTLEPPSQPTLEPQVIEARPELRGEPRAARPQRPSGAAPRPEPRTEETTEPPPNRGTTTAPSREGTVDPFALP